MKNLKHYLLILLTAFSVTFSACDDDDDSSEKFDDGIFVINEGNYGHGDGTVSHINEDNGKVSQDIFKTANHGLALGDVVQSMTIDEDLAYVVVNNDNRVEVVDAESFKSEYTITGLALPRYFTTFNGKGYVTEWVSFSAQGRVSIIDLEDHTVEGSITTDYGAENIIAYDGKLYVSNNFTNTVSVIDPATEEVVKTIEVGTAPGAFLVDKNDMLWVICGGGTDEDWNPLNDGKLVQIDPTAGEVSNGVQKTIELGVNVNPKMAINKAKDKIFYYKGKSVYVVNITDTEAPSTALITEATATSFYGIGIDPENDMLYVGDSKAFASNGAVYRYTLTGSFINTVAAGIGPNSFVFE